MILDVSNDTFGRLSMSNWYFYRLVFRIRLMRMFRLELSKLLEGKSVDMEIEVEDRSLFLHFEGGKPSIRRKCDSPARVKLSFRSFALLQNVFRSAMAGDQFWLSAMRDHRVNITGDMSVVLWFFSLCRHLPLRVR